MSKRTWRHGLSIAGLAIMVSVLGRAPAARADLTGYWPLNGDGIATVGTDGNLINGPTASIDRNGAAGGGLSFNGGLSQYVTVPGGGGLNAASVGTISMWVNWQGAQGGGCCGGFGSVLARQSNAIFSNDIIGLSNPDPNSAGVTWRQNHAGGPLITGATAVGDNTWRHVAVTFAPAGSELFLNGVSQGTGIGGPFNDNPGIGLAIGAWDGDGGAYSNSMIDDVAIFDHVLTATEILDLADQAIGPLEVPPFMPPPPPPPHPHLLGVGAKASSELAGFNRRAINTIDGSGLIVGNAHLPGPFGAMWLNQGTFPGGPADLDPEITFDLGGVYNVNTMRVWNYNEGPCCLGRGLAKADIYTAGEDGVFGLHTAGQTFTVAPGSATDFSQVIGLGGVQARYVKLDVDTTAGVANHAGDNNFVGLSEVQFDGTPVLDKAPLPIAAVTASSELAGFDRKAAYAGDLRGAFGAAHTIGPDGNMWLNQGSFPNGPPADVDPSITFDLGRNYTVEKMIVWNYNEMLPGRPELLARGISKADIWLAGEDGMFSLYADDFALAMAPGDDAVDYGQTIVLETDLRYVKLTDLANFPGGDFDFVGLSEVKFFGVPEPSSVALAGMGAALIAGVALRRRQRRA